LSYPDDIWHADRPSEESDITRSDVEVKLSTATIILKIDKTSYLHREWSDVGEMWHADAEWHDNYGDEVKIETEKDDGLKPKIAHWSCR